MFAQDFPHHAPRIVTEGTLRTARPNIPLPSITNGVNCHQNCREGSSADFRAAQLPVWAPECPGSPDPPARPRRPDRISPRPVLCSLLLWLCVDTTRTASDCPPGQMILPT